MLKHGVCRSYLLYSAVALGACNRSDRPPAAGTPVVEYVRVVQRDVPIYREWVATLDGYVNAQIRPQVTGYLLAQRFREGSHVRKGEVLFDIDARPFRAALSQAEADLAQAMADERRTARDVERDRPLAEARAIPRNQLDNDIEAHKAAMAAVDAARAQVREAQINLGFTQVRSLINGIVGITDIQIGNLVSPATVLTTVSQVQPIKAFFAISEQEYLDATDRVSAPALLDAVNGDGMDGNGTNGDAHGDVVFEMYLTDGSKYPHPGTFLFADRQIDSLTGTIRVATSFPNPGSRLRPGQFARLRAATRIQRGALLVPQRAVSQLQGSWQVMVLQRDSTVKARTVHVGPRVDSLWVIERGLAVGELVIVEGMQKLRDSVKVNPKPYRFSPSPAAPKGR
jgi:membrane fusion protein (multidrug efflux system)